ncbi:MAG: hypothetical protein R6X02_01945 [Enhygromyxa sp.]
MRWGLKSFLFSLALLLGASSSLLGGCGGAADLVELRLYPCGIDDIEPRAVLVELTGFDEQGETVETYEVAFDNIAATVFEDGYATLGYRKGPAVVRARVRLGWFAATSASSLAEADAIAVYEDVVVPDLGEVLDLRSSACSEVAGDGDGDSSGDGDGDSGDGDGDSGDGDGDSGDGDGDSGDGDGDPTGDGDGDSGDGDGDPTGDGDGDPTGDGDGDSGDGDGDPEQLPQIGDPCDSFNTNFHCVPAPDAGAGTPLFCSPVTNELESTNTWLAACSGLCPEGSFSPINACAGYGHPARCLCEPTAPENCEDATLGCTGDGLIKLCHAGMVVIGQCNDCTMSPGGYYSCSR